jgi:hypothetical protein
MKSIFGLIISTRVVFAYRNNVYARVRIIVANDSLNMPIVE